MIESEVKFAGLWVAKTGDANAWYHIYPFARARNSKRLHIVRHREAFKEVPNSEYHIFKKRGFLTHPVNMFFKGFSVLKNRDIDYIVSFNPVPWGMIAWLLAKMFRKPVILGYIGSDFYYHFSKTKLKSILNFINKSSDIITVTGNHMIKPIMDGGVSRDKIFIFPHCVSDDWFDYSFNEYKYDLITVCPLEKRKRVHDIIDAVHLLHDRGNKVRLCVLGDGPELQSLQKRASEKGLSDFVHFLGFERDVLRYLLQSKIYVQASDNEGLSLSLVEAMAAGLVPISTVAGSERDHIKDGENGYLIPIGNPPEMAEKIQATVEENNYMCLKENVLNYRHNFRMEHAIQVCEELIEQVTEKANAF